MSWFDNVSWGSPTHTVKVETLPPPIKKQEPIRYVVGFMFNLDHSRVVLIRKNRPDCQRGRYNGVGGKVESSDFSDYAAMTREFHEETGVHYWAWDHYATLKGKFAEVYVFRAFSSLADGVRTMTDEQIHLCVPGNLPEAVLPNVRFLIPLARTSGYKPVEFEFEEAN